MRDTLDGEKTSVPSMPDTLPAQRGRLEQEAEARFDEGLVHEHGWACRERGAQAC